MAQEVTGSHGHCPSMAAARTWPNEAGNEVGSGHWWELVSPQQLKSRGVSGGGMGWAQGSIT